MRASGSIPVKDVMSSPVVMVSEDDDVNHVALLLTENDIGSIVVTDLKGNPVGLITERDIVTRIAARNLLPGNVKAKEVMSSPLRTIDSNEDIIEAADRMRAYGIRRLIVMDEWEMVGIVSSRDIVTITPALIGVIVEKARMTQRLPLIRKTSSAGYCDRCRQWSNTLESVNGTFICEECRIELEA
jgi:CBS domain-containing protein